jgi:ribonuclease HI
MELTALITALEALKNQSTVDINSCSA